MLIVGLTGGIGMGKSTLASYFKRWGDVVFDSDACVHHLFQTDPELQQAIAAQWPAAVTPEGQIDRKRLGKAVFADPQQRLALEALVHPRLWTLQTRLIHKASRQRRRLVVLDTPLLFETGGPKRCDVVVTASTSALIQRHRVLKRPHMTVDKFNAILRSQCTDAERRRLADYVIYTGASKAAAYRQLVRVRQYLLRAY